MKIEEMHRSECCGCEACANACPKKCIAMTRDAEGFAYPKINHELCVRCGKCDATCPSLNLREKIIKALPGVFVAVNRDAKIRRHSSSGGVFSALSEQILNDGGIVFGAGFDENWHVHHTSAENLDELENLRGSKYVQSQIGNVYQRVKAELDSGRKVLFSGTSCQCAGLKSFLGSDNDNLLTVDIICHGTPSPYLWESYIEWLGRGHEITRVNFRSKRFGWTNSHLEITFKDCGYYAKRDMQDFYFQEFLLNLTLRPSCGTCKFRFPNTSSDLTIGDAWGIQSFAPKMFDNKGASMVILYNQKSVDILNRAKMLVVPVKFDVLLNHNPLFIIPTPEDSRRQNFFDDLARFKLPISVMQKYFLQNPAPISAETGRQTHMRMADAVKNLSRQLQQV